MPAEALGLAPSKNAGKLACLVSLLLSAAVIACGGGSKTVAVTIIPGATVTVYPTAGVTLSPGETFQFTDTVTNVIDTSNQSTAVYWYVNGVQGGNATTGTITTAGLYSAPTQIGSSTTFVIKATLQADSTSSGQTNASVIPVGAPTLSAVNPSTVAQSSYFEDVYLN